LQDELLPTTAPLAKADRKGRNFEALPGWKGLAVPSQYCGKCPF